MPRAMRWMPRWVAVFWVVSCAICLAQRTSKPNATEEAAIRHWLANYAGAPDPEMESAGPSRFLAEIVDLSGPASRDAIIYVFGRGWCGSGGCPTFVLRPTGNGYSLVTRLTITWPPIRVLPTEHKGWHDLSVYVHGGGIRVPYTARIPFNGASYASNPSMPPAQPMAEARQGKVIIPESVFDDGTPLYGK